MQADERSWLADLHMVVVSGARRDKQLNNDLGYIKDQATGAAQAAAQAANAARAEAAAAKQAVQQLNGTVGQAVGEAVATYFQAHPPVVQLDYDLLAGKVADEQARRLAE